MELVISVGLLTVVILIADLSLALQGNWPKILSVTLSAATYVAVLGMLLKSVGRFPAPPSRLPLWVFLASGAVAGLVSGMAGPGLQVPLVLASAILTPALLGALHWVVLQRWAWVRARIVSRSSGSGRPPKPGGGQS